MYTLKFKAINGMGERSYADEAEALEAYAEFTAVYKYVILVHEETTTTTTVLRDSSAGGA